MSNRNQVGVHKAKKPEKMNYSPRYNLLKVAIYGKLPLNTPTFADP